jgi:transcription initiation factor IIF auxiliary subunit
VKANKNGYVNDNWWTAFIRLKNAPDGLKIDRIVKHCFFKLHESFRVADHKVKVTPSSFDKNKNTLAKPGEISLSYKGWGYFDMPIEVHFKD